MVSLILASTSRFRRALLDRLGLPYEARAPRFEEIEPEDLSPRDVARAFAEGKAKSIDAGPGTWVIGADQVPELDGRVLRKTESRADCRVELAALSGRTHTLHTAVVLWSPAEKRIFGETVTVELTMRKLDSAQIDRYVALDDPVGSAGGYLFEKRGIGLFEAVRGGDDSAIVGLSLLSLCRLLREAGIEPLDLAR